MKNPLSIESAGRPRTKPPSTARTKTFAVVGGLAMGAALYWVAVRLDLDIDLMSNIFLVLSLLMLAWTGYRAHAERRLVAHQTAERDRARAEARNQSVTTSVEPRA